jgi:undecaprenyl diphosphate synthase
LPVIAGHHRGAELIEKLVGYAAKRGIKYVTFWAFSSENWKRGEREVGFIMRVFREFIKSSVGDRMVQKGVRVNVIGDLESFPEDIVRGVREVIERSRKNTEITATFALN